MTIQHASLALAALLGTALAAPAEAQSNGDFAGTIACEKMATTRAASQAPFLMKVEGGQASFSREVVAVDGSPMGMAEQAKGSIAPDGALVLAATVDEGSFHFESRYEGQLGEKSGKLAGTQTWLLGKDRMSRKCTITVSRRAAPPAKRDKKS